MGADPPLQVPHVFRLDSHSPADLHVLENAKTKQNIGFSLRKWWYQQVFEIGGRGVQPQKMVLEMGCRLCFPMEIQSRPPIPSTYV